MDSLFGDLAPAKAGQEDAKEAQPLDRLKVFDDKISSAINKVKHLKEEKTAIEERVIALQGKVAELETRIREKDEEIGRLSSEKMGIKEQIEDLLNELESIEVN